MRVISKRKIRLMIKINKFEVKNEKNKICHFNRKFNNLTNKYDIEGNACFYSFQTQAINQKTGHDYKIYISSHLTNFRNPLLIKCRIELTKVF